MTTPRVTLVTGGGSGLGKALCQEVGRRGGIVVVTDIDGERAESAATRIVQDGGQATALVMDVTSAHHVRQVVDRVRQQYGRIDCYFNNAGISFAGEARDMVDDHWKRIIDVNLWGVIHGVQAVYPIMIEQGSGHIVNIASMAGIVANVHAPGYTVTKFAVMGLSDALRIEAEDLGVRISVVCPGAIRTGIRDATPYLGIDKQAFLEDLERMHKAKWFAQEWDADMAARYIVSQVEKGAYLILLPPAAKAIRLVARFFPGYVVRVQRKLLRNFRRHRVG